MRLGQAAYNLEKAFTAIHAGFGRADDYPPVRYMNEPVDRGPFAGQRCGKDLWGGMLDRFYELNGWDVKTGLQTRVGLNDLGLDDVADQLAAAVGWPDTIAAEPAPAAHARSGGAPSWL